MKPACTEEEFVNIWSRLQSASLVAKELGINERPVHARRRAMEAKGWTFKVTDRRKPAMLITDDRVEVKLTLHDGVIIVSGDQHFHPGNIPTMHKAYCYLAKKLQPYALIWNGDAFDGASISRHPSIGWENKPSVRQELECVKDRSAEVIKACPNAKRIWSLGNHDARMETRLATVAHEYRDVHGMHLKDHIPEWTPAWFVTVNEGTESWTEIRHREKGGLHAGYNNTKESGVTLVTGHDHRADVVAYDDRRGRRYGVRHGMGADSSRDAPFVNYLEGKHTNWQAAIAVLTYKDGVLLQPELALRMGPDTFQFRGEIIKV
jgi:hypothetical protein